MKKQLLFAFGAAALLASCSNDIDSPVANVNDGYLKVNGTINEVKTRATETSFENNDAIGVTTNSGTSFVEYKYNGSTFEAEGDGVKVASNLSVSAYFPYQESVSNNEISFDVTSQSGVDFLYATAVSVTPDSPTANLTFNHAMSKLSFTVKDVDSQFTNGETFTLGVSEVATTGKFNIATGVVTSNEANGSLSSDISLNTAKSFIVPSSTQENEQAISLVVTVSNGDTYLANVTPKFAAGTQYNYTLNIKKDTPDMNVGGNIGQWEQEGNEDVDTEKGEKPYELAIGDFLLKDGTTIAPNKYTDQDVVGVVYYVANGDELTTNGFPKSSGLAIAINNANDGTVTKFAGSKFDFPTWVNGKISEGSDYIKGTGFGTGTIPTELLGYNYTKIIKEATTEKGGQSASAEDTGCDALITLLSNYDSTYPVQNASSWYVPSYGEFSKILENYAKINASVTMANGTLEQYSDFVATGNSNCYWVSDMRNATNNWVHPLAETQETTIWKDKTKAQGGYFRFAIAF